MTRKNIDFVDLVEELDFVASRSQQEAKAGFWAVAADSPMVDPADLTLAAVQQLCPDTRIKHWWSQPGFREWFCNKNEWRQRVEYLVNKGLDAIEDVLSDPDAAPSARVKAFEVLARLSDKEPARVKEVRFSDSFINNMSEAQLEEYVRRQSKQLLAKEPDGNEEDTK
jgi:hypothetical protein